ncbi:unnamed protein product [Hydatigera taeniaeformis]|uniref:Uncharacterized protein n=1 Tax=Hydatigena taeniaeformis TaxID=6205 RepID=A0A0R3WV27_HYDTA|nr:unnamed protein product [Hydatigera taeniaeformis]
MDEDRCQIDFKPLSLENVLMLEQILRNLFATTAAAITAQPTTQPSLPPIPEPAMVKQPDQPLDLSMKSDMSSVEDLDYASGSEGIKEVHGISMDDSFLDQHLDGELLQCKFINPHPECKCLY